MTETHLKANAWSCSGLTICVVAMVTDSLVNLQYCGCWFTWSTGTVVCVDKYLYVDEVLAVLDHVDIGVVDGLLVVFDAG